MNPSQFLLCSLFLGNLAFLQVHGQRQPPPPQCRGATKVRWADPRGVSHNYMFSWENSHLRGVEVDWSNAQNICRQHCMNLVSLETPAENNFVKARLAFGRQRYIWTSGRKSNNNSWFWAGSGAQIGPVNNRANGDWSHSGGAGRPQPDNRENTRGLEGYNGIEESCLTILNNFYNDGIKWHDVACYHVKPFVCESN